MRKLIALLPLLGSCMHGDLKIDYLKEKGQKPSLEIHVDFSAADESVEIQAPPTLDNVLHKQVFAF
jgi:hypothetical protein